MPRFFAEPENIKGNTITLYSDDAAHISRVLRGKTGDILTVCDGTGSDYIAEITDISDKSVILEIKETLDTKSEPLVKITLYQMGILMLRSRYLWLTDFSSIVIFLSLVTTSARPKPVMQR